jgi:FKBP-type peptidyl-prolyl cis-trans isomerase
MNTVKNLIIMVFAAAILVSCGKTSYKNTAGGMPYKVFEGKDTQKVRVGDYIKVALDIKVNDSLVNTTGKLPTYIQVTATSQPYDLSELWTKLKVGDSVVVTQMIDTFMKRSPDNFPPQFKKGDRVFTYLKVLGLFTNDSLVRMDSEKERNALAVIEIAEVEKYLADKKITAQKTPSGAFVEVINPGTGNLPDTGNYVTVNYTGTSWSGKRFDSNVDTAFHHAQPYSFEAGVGRMSKGFDEAMLLLRKGAKGKIYVPSLLAYGGQPGTPLIKPYEHLIFDIEMLDIKDKAPAQSAGPQRPGQQPVNVDRPQQ